MSFKPPSFLISATPGQGLSPLDVELAGEKADMLARAGRKLEKALEKLEAARSSGEAVSEAVDDAADAAWALFIQRELCGLRRQADAVRLYGIPKDVMARLGAGKRRETG
ncbi:hypothetical protein FE840_005170 [Peteryoungia desertarenae]|uniref:Uncharacterized protein n=1 Tax=Peteryoungia desertarenae TaxID=1813451 RepID=A0ABX6QLL4_9HYPH|nr:DUF6665 family protein [Peteryoungia desertarenae]QLF68980.1 hypothetical protein FE840_005170 [Peteryoungia desertarenae]